MSRSPEHPTSRPAPPDREAQSPGGEPSAAQAQAMLAQAAGAARTLPAPVPAVLICYGILCAVGTFGTLGMHLAPYMTAPPGGLSPTVTILIFAFMWIGAAIIAGMVFRERWRRGLSTRWLVYIGVWAVLWVLGMTLGGTMLGMFIAPAFVVPFVIAVSTEAAKARDARQAQQAGAGR